MPTPTSPGDHKLIADVESYGWHVLKVDGHDSPDFAYTVGLFRNFGHPELIVVGLPGEVAHAILNIAGEAIREGKRYALGPDYDDFLNGYDCTFREVPEELQWPYFGFARWYYDARPFPGWQVVYPDMKGRWPWDLATEAGFREQQPVIGERGIPEWARRRRDG